MTAPTAPLSLMNPYDHRTTIACPMPAPVPAAATQLVAREFANRYLESVGVRPSRATLDLVHRNVALGEEHIRATLRVGPCGPQ